MSQLDKVFDRIRTVDERLARLRAERIRLLKSAYSEEISCPPFAERRCPIRNRPPWQSDVA
jgi:hypothetical protein